MRNVNTPVPPSDGQLHDDPGLEFPDWSGMTKVPNHLPLGAILRMSEQYRTYFPESPLQVEWRISQKTTAEFVL